MNYYVMPFSLGFTVAMFFGCFLAVIFGGIFTMFSLPPPLKVNWPAAISGGFVGLAIGVALMLLLSYLRYGNLRFRMPLPFQISSADAPRDGEPPRCTKCASVLAAMSGSCAHARAVKRYLAR